MKKNKVGFYITNSILTIVIVVFALLTKNFVGMGLMLGIIGLSIAFLAATFILDATNKQTAAKLAFIVHFVFAFIMLVVFFFDKIGIFEVADSVEEMRDFIKQFGYAKWTFVFIQFFQVLFLPIPTTITLLAGLLLFSPWEVVLYSLIGIIPGSILMFFFGKYAGRKAVNWALGKDQVDKYLDMIKGKDVSLLTVMFLMPFFPDDTLCAIAGLSTMKFRYFFPVILITRFLMCVTSVFLVASNVIPFSGWGIAVWIAIAAIVVGLLILMWKKGDVFQAKISSWFDNLAKKMKMKKEAKAKAKEEIKK